MLLPFLVGCVNHFYEYRWGQVNKGYTDNEFMESKGCGSKRIGNHGFTESPLGMSQD